MLHPKSPSIFIKHIYIITYTAFKHYQELDILKMCTAGANECTQVHLFSHKRRRTKVRVLRLSSMKKRQPEERIGGDMELKNLKLYMENISIYEENEKLRKQADLLYRENLALMSELLKGSSRRDFVSMAPNKMPSK